MEMENENYENFNSKIALVIPKTTRENIFTLTQ